MASTMALLFNERGDTIPKAIQVRQMRENVCNGRKWGERVATKEVELPPT